MHSKREYCILEESKTLGPQALESQDLSTELKEIAIFRKKIYQCAERDCNILTLICNTVKFAFN
jgi:hypothetical protein